MNKREFQTRARFRHKLRLARVPDGASLLLAVSGGCDSISLLHLCLDEAERRAWKLTIGHIDHSLRPDSAADADWVRNLAAHLGVPFAGLRLRREFWGRHPGESIEDLARRVRRRGLRRLAKRHGANWILLGHTRDDQAETVLLNLLRGSGVRGLGAMPACRGVWLRPLMDVSRSDLRTLAAARGWEWREDPTNEDPRFLRNRIRRELMPLLEREFQPGAARVLARTADSLRPVRRFLRAEAARAFSEVCLEESAAGMRLERGKLASYDRVVIEEVLRWVYRRLRGSTRDLKRAHLVTVARAICSDRQGTFSFPAGLEVVLNRQVLSVSHPTKERSDAGDREPDSGHPRFGIESPGKE